MNNRYILMYKDIPILSFCTDTQEVCFLNRNLLPRIVKHSEENWDAVRMFCSSRMLMTNREYCKEILTSCGIDDQTDVNICIVSKALSFRDNYWIRHSDSLEKWKDVNLYSNPFSTDIAFTALTGESKTVHIGDNLYTGELTNKGTRAKCFVRQDNRIFLAKVETPREIAAEILSYVIAFGLGLNSAKYISANVYGKQCSVCAVNTSERVELVPCRDVIADHRCEMKAESPYYHEFMNADATTFAKMQVFDYLTLNTDRNRDNFGLRMVDGKPAGLYPLFDHDSCFKGKSEQAHYFVTGKTFKETLDFLTNNYRSLFAKEIVPAVHAMHHFFAVQGAELFKLYGLEDCYDSFMERAEKILEMDLVQQKSDDCEYEEKE